MENLREVNGSINDRQKIEILEDKAVDLDSFEALTGGYAKDQNFIYYMGETISSDADNLSIINKRLVKDSNYVYVDGVKNYEVNINDFTKINGEYYHDYKNFYHLKGKVGKYSDNFNALNETHIIIDEKVFFLNNPILGADVNSFEVFDSRRYSKDSNFIYKAGEKIPNVDIDSFKLIDDGRDVGIDNQYIYSYGKQANRIDIDSYIYLGNGLSRDSNGYYLGSNIIEISNYEHIGRNFLKSLENITVIGQFGEGDIINSVDLETFKVFYRDISKDKNSVYLKNKPMVNLDASTFNRLNDFFYKDKNGIYQEYSLKKINLDSNTIKDLGNGYITDTNNIYRFGRQIEGVDSDSFEVLNPSYSKDKNNIYFHEKRI